MTDTPRLFGMLIDDATPAERKEMFGRLPIAARLYLRTLGAWRLPAVRQGRSPVMTDGETELDDATLATIDRWLTYRVWHCRVPGAQVAIGYEGRLIFSRAYGYADLEHRRPMRTDHLFRIASHSKTFTATLVLQLVERDQLRLDDRLGEHLPEFAEKRSATSGSGSCSSTPPECCAMEPTATSGRALGRSLTQPS